jgi:hypothetical protein
MLISPVNTAAEASADHSAVYGISVPDAFDNFAAMIPETFANGSPAVVKFNDSVSFITTVDSDAKIIAWGTTATGTQGIYEYKFYIFENNVTAKLNIIVI